MKLANLPTIDGVGDLDGTSVTSEGEDTTTGGTDSFAEL